MKRYTKKSFKKKLNKVYYIDAIKGMKKIPNKSIDLVLTDPPYGTTACSWDSIIPLDKMWKELKRIIKDNGAIVVIAGQPFTTMLIASNIEMFKYCWYWEKERITNSLNCKIRAGKIVEECVVFYKQQPKYYPIKTIYRGKPVRNKPKGNYTKISAVNKIKVTPYKDDGTRYPTQIIKFNRDLNKMHPTQKPVALMEYLIKTYTNEGDIVLDFAIGSGTTAVAAKILKRNFIGFDTEKGYIEIAKRRIEKTEVPISLVTDTRLV